MNSWALLVNRRWDCLRNPFQAEERPAAYDPQWACVLAHVRFHHIQICSCPSAGKPAHHLPVLPLNIFSKLIYVLNIYIYSLFLHEIYIYYDK